MSLNEPYDSDNIFAKILRGDIPAAIINETEHTLALMDAFPQSKGHALIIPKTPGATNLLTAEPDMLGHLIVETQRIAKAARAALEPDGIRIMQFNGSAAGQTVYHLHFHVIPMWESDPLLSHGTAQADIAELDQIADQIKKHLQ